MKKKTFLLCASFLISLAISPFYNSHILAEETVNTTTTVQSPVVVSTTETATETSVTTTEASTVVTTTPTSENTTSATTQISEATPGTPQAESAPGKVAIYRLYNPRNGEHLYTTDANEKNVLYKSHGWGYEGIGWYAPDTGTPVYRLYNAGLQNHLYTTDTNEVNVLTSRHGWKSDNNGRPVFYSGGAVNIYRVYNPKLRGLHHWTTDKNEYNVLPKHGWKQEGIKFKGIQNGKPIRTQYHKGNYDLLYQTVINRYKSYLKIIKKGDYTQLQYLMNQNKNIDGQYPYILLNHRSANSGFNFYGYLKYTYADINKDGIHEMFLSTGSPIGVGAVYSLSNGKPNLITTTPDARTHLSIFTDGSIGSHSIGYNGVYSTLYQIKNGRPVTVASGINHLTGEPLPFLKNKKDYPIAQLSWHSLNP